MKIGLVISLVSKLLALAIGRAGSVKDKRNIQAGLDKAGRIAAESEADARLNQQKIADRLRARFAEPGGFSAWLQERAAEAARDAGVNLSVPAAASLERSGLPDTGRRGQGDKGKEPGPGDQADA